MMNYFERSVLTTLVAGICFTSFGQTSKQDAPNGWHLKDKQKDGLYGISLDKAYQFLKGKKKSPGCGGRH